MYFNIIFRLDKDQCIRRLAKETFKINDPDYYEFEGNIYNGKPNCYESEHIIMFINYADCIQTVIISN